MARANSNPVKNVKPDSGDPYRVQAGNYSVAWNS